jgi:two-component system CheB/CheR fusion protein
MDVKTEPRAQSHADALVASLAHEINNPLDALLNLLHLIEADSILTPQVCSYLSLAKEEVRRISHIAQAAMDRYRTPEGRQSTNVPQLLHAVVDFYKSRLDSQDISVLTRYCCAKDLPVDSSSLRQVFSNLLLNAAQAMPEGGTIYARVSAAHEWTGLRRRGLRVTFADNGCGIDARNVPRITETFFTTKGAAGTGLGLAFVRDTVERTHGALRLRTSTRPGRKGTVFSIFLPFD